MMNKLAFRNVKRSARDYLVYFMTMAVVTALMFSFHTLLFSEDVQKLFDMANMMAVMTGIATFFIVLIVAWLINYMVRFILEKRSREFGIYLLIGMKKREISRLYIRENVMLGMGAFLAGMGLGVLLQQILLSVFYSMVQMDYHIHLEWNKNCILTTAACFFGCYLLALLRCRKRFKKMNIHDLMESQRRNEETSEKHEKRKRVLLPLSILILILFGVFLFCYKNWDTGILTVLSVQQLSDSVKYRFRYRVLSQIGYGRREINRIILKQLLGYYMCPAVMALLISGLVTVYAGNRFNFYTGIHTSSAAYFLMGAALFFGIYAAYFTVTYIGFKRNVKSS